MRKTKNSFADEKRQDRGRFSGLMVKDTGPACVSAFEPSPNPLVNEKEQGNII
jgi:hypothetical protein